MKFSSYVSFANGKGKHNETCVPNFALVVDYIQPLLSSNEMFAQQFPLRDDESLQAFVKSL